MRGLNEERKVSVSKREKRGGEEDFRVSKR